MEQYSASARDISVKAKSVAASAEKQLALVENISQASDRLRGIVRSVNESAGAFKL